MRRKGEGGWGSQNLLKANERNHPAKLIAFDSHCVNYAMSMLLKPETSEIIPDQSYTRANEQTVGGGPAGRQGLPFWNYMLLQQRSLLKGHNRHFQFGPLITLFLPESVTANWESVTSWVM